MATMIQRLYKMLISRQSHDIAPISSAARFAACSGLISPSGAITASLRLGRDDPPPSEPFDFFFFDLGTAGTSGLAVASSFDPSFFFRKRWPFFLTDDSLSTAIVPSDWCRREWRGLMGLGDWVWASRGDSSISWHGKFISVHFLFV
jgi:hypothetical protein